jgi:hypothetical protein
MGGLRSPVLTTYRRMMPLKHQTAGLGRTFWFDGGAASGRNRRNPASPMRRAKDCCPPRADPQRRHKRQIYRLAQKIQQAQRGQHHRREDDAERGPGSLPARRQSRKLLLNDLKLGTRSLTLVTLRHLSSYCAQLSSWASPMRSPSGPRM